MFSILHFIKRTSDICYGIPSFRKIINTRLYKFNEFIKHFEPVLTNLMSFFVGIVFLMQFILHQQIEYNIQNDDKTVF